MGYLDDFTAVGEKSILAKDFEMVRDMASDMGLSLNINKCEIIACNGFDNLPIQFAHFLKVDSQDCEMLGAPLFKGDHLSKVLSSKLTDLTRASSRLKLLHSHDALLILKHSLSAPKLMYTLRTSPCSDHPLLADFDLALRASLSAITNNDLSDPGWVQATLPVGRGGPRYWKCGIARTFSFSSFRGRHFRSPKPPPSASSRVY
jgi:hypothetical protein